VEWESIHGLMVVNMKENGKITIWRELVSISGMMVENTKVNIKMIKSMGMEFIHGLMVVAMRVTGIKENSMELVLMLYQKITKLNMVFGKMGSVLNGSMKMMFRVSMLRDLIIQHNLIRQIAMKW
jgi:hypothetical protein